MNDETMKILAFLLITFFIAAPSTGAVQAKGGNGMDFSVTSPAFTEGEVISKEFSCEGSDISPELIWQGAPQGTLSYALIADDPDAPVGTFTHWVIYDIPGGNGGLPQDVEKSSELADGTKQGKNGFGRIAYGGPCPPPGHGPHRYFFKLSALDVASLGLAPGASKTEVLNAMSGHILAEISVMGTYERR